MTCPDPQVGSHRRHPLLADSPGLHDLVMSCTAPAKLKQQDYLEFLVDHMGWRPADVGTRMGQLGCGVGGTLQEQQDVRSPNPLPPELFKRLCDAVKQGFRPFLLLTELQAQVSSSVSHVHPCSPCVCCSAAVAVGTCC